MNMPITVPMVMGSYRYTHVQNYQYVTFMWASASQSPLVVNNTSANAGDTSDMGSIPGLRRSPGGGNGNLLQYSCLENPMDRGVWQTTVHRITKSQTRLTTYARTPFIVCQQ